MRINQDTVLTGEKVVLVPYQPDHVPKYHEWMCDKELRLLTASEPLSLEEEYQMQQQWLTDEDKLTFIILASNETLEEGNDSDTSPIKPSALQKLSPTDPRVTSLPMIGDVNIFLKGSVPHLSNHLDFQRPKDGDDEDHDVFEAEVEIMIAEPAYRRRGCALEALQLMLSYATGAPSAYFGFLITGALAVDAVPTSLRIPPACLVTRISDSNIASVRLFEKLGFRETKRVEIFSEVEMRWFQTIGVDMVRSVEDDKSNV